MRRRLAIVLLAVVTIASLSCDRGAGGEADGAPLVLDGRARLPEQQGVVESVSRERIELDGGRTYRVSPKVQSFSTQTMQAVPLLGREGQFVHIGVEGDTMVWFATIADVFPGDPPVAYYTGVLEKVEGRRAYFRDGTVLDLARGVEPPVESGFVQVEIDPRDAVVRRLAVP